MTKFCLQCGDHMIRHAFRHDHYCAGCGLPEADNERMAAERAAKPKPPAAAQPELLAVPTAEQAAPAEAQPARRHARRH